jgi:hypothetical protein
MAEAVIAPGCSGLSRQVTRPLGCRARTNACVHFTVALFSVFQKFAFDNREIDW